MNIFVTYRTIVLRVAPVCAELEMIALAGEVVTVTVLEAMPCGISGPASILLLAETVWPSPPLPAIA